MKQVKLSLLPFVVFFAVLGITACKKDPTPAPANGVEGTWQMISSTFSPSVDGEADFIAQLKKSGDTCPERTRFVFYGNGTVFVHAPSECSETKSRLKYRIDLSGQATWKTRNDTLFIVSASENSGIFALDVDASHMTLTKKSVSMTNGKTYTTTTVFARSPQAMPN